MGHRPRAVRGHQRGALHHVSHEPAGRLYRRDLAATQWLLGLDRRPQLLAVATGLRARRTAVVLLLHAAAAVRDRAAHSGPDRHLRRPAATTVLLVLRLLVRHCATDL